MTLSAKLFGACVCAALLAACGGGGGGSGPQTVFTYQQFGETTVAGESTIAAVGQARDEEGLVSGTEVIIGTLDRTSRALTIGDLVVTVNADPDQPWLGGGGVVQRIQDFEEDLVFLVPVTITEGDFGSQYVVGVAARSQDLPTIGSVNYAGTALVGGILAEPSENFESTGNLVLTARFAGNRGVDADITGLNGAPFQTVEIKNLAIVNRNGSATFTMNGDSTITFRNTDGPVTPISGNLSESVDGAFYGGLPNVAGPIEAGGVFAVVGEDGNIFGIFAGSRQ